MNANAIPALDQTFILEDRAGHDVDSLAEVTDGPLEHKLLSLDRVEIFRQGEGPAVVVGYAFGGRELMRSEQETMREAHAVAERWMTSR